MENTPPDQKPDSARKERLRRARASSPRTQRATRPPSPTRSIEPGIAHYRIAQGILTGIQEKVKEATDRELDVGEFPPVAETGVQNDDPQLIPRLTAHAVARIADRFPIFRRVSRHFEGTERRAGILSDLAAALVALYKRNPETMEVLAKQLGEELQGRRAAAKAQHNGGVSHPSQPQPSGGVKPHATA